jgi:hypothetical protein
VTEQNDPASPAFTRALIAELSKKTGVSWLRYGSSPQAHTAHAAWHLWYDEALYVVSGGNEQPLPGIEDVDRVEVTMRSKENGGRLLTWVATRSDVRPEDEAWEPVTAALAADRLNLDDLAAAVRDWAERSVVSRLEPTGETLETPDALPDGSHVAPPRPTPATTRGRLPTVLHRRVRRRPKLS